MRIQTGIGFSKDLNDEAAVKQAAMDAKKSIEFGTIDLAIIFATAHYDLSRIQKITQRILNSKRTIGSTTAGIILENSIETHGVAILTISSEDMIFGAGHLEVDKTIEPYDIGKNLTQECLNDFQSESRHLFLYFIDGRIQGNNQIIKGMQDMLGNISSFVGVGSSDDFHFQDNFQLHNDKIIKNSCCGLFVGGRIHIGISGKHGWKPLGKPRIIEKATDNIVHQISGQKASSIYDHYLKEEIKNISKNQFEQISILYPLGIHIPGSDEYLLRNVLSIKPDGSLICQGDIPVGSQVHLMISNKDICRKAANEAAIEAKKNLLGKEPRLLLIFESMARLKLLGRSAFYEIKEIRTHFPANIPIFGMYSNGEMYPFQTIEKYKKTHRQNESIVIIAIG